MSVRITPNFGVTHTGFGVGKCNPEHSLSHLRGTAEVQTLSVRVRASLAFWRFVRCRLGAWHRHDSSQSRACPPGTGEHLALFRPRFAAVAHTKIGGVYFTAKGKGDPKN